ncbi:hypothetical protein TSUD_149250 [Trifolium subterraneum]|uniref:F-box/LRR-repeat protein 15-like leucin rich repeat domain-containing protein n=1 Tax=Trifolium subterraneum TaxID=3900 RepID=A0A2Z6NHR8_TRISU|nr:hypothetical protein TSUD_149250 [Trifolium subterraneum]
MAFNSRKRMALDVFPSDCWELVISKLLDNEEEERKHYLETLSLVSKQLLSVTNTFVYSFKLFNNIPSSSLPILIISRIFNRFPNLTSLDLSTYRGRYADDLNELISRIPPRSFSCLTSLNLSNNPIIPASGLRSILKNNNTSSRLTSLICSNVGCLKFTDITFIADSFPFLQHLDISFPGGGGGLSHLSHQVKDYNNALNLLSQKLSKLRTVDFSGNFYINDSSFLQLCINCEFLQEVLMPDCPFITHAGIAEAIHHRPTLNSFYVTDLKKAIHEPEKVNFVDSITSLKRLTCLDLSFSCINDLLLQSIALEALPLTKLVLQGCYNYTYNGISCLLSKSPSLQHLDLQLANFLNDEFLIPLCAFLAGLVSINVSGCRNLALEALPLTKHVLQGCYNYTYNGISCLLSKSPSLQHLDLQLANFLNDEFLIPLCAFLAGLVSINVSGCRNLGNSSFFSLLSNCPLLADIRMESTSIGIGPTPLDLDLAVYPQVNKIRHLKFDCIPQAKLFWIDFKVCGLEHLDLQLANFLNDEFLIPLCGFLAGLVSINVSGCRNLGNSSFFSLLSNCPLLADIRMESTSIGIGPTPLDLDLAVYLNKIRHLKFDCIPQAKLFWIDFKVCGLEVLNLSHSRIDDKNLDDISKICPRLLQLDLEHCCDVTEKGVRLAVENCTRLREINFQCCLKVSTDTVSRMIFSRPSLRKITAPPHFRLRHCDSKLLSERCLVFLGFCKCSG